MRLSELGFGRVPLGRIALYGGILLLLAASLTGFFLLINFLVELVSLGPRDLAAVNPSEEENVSLPSGVEVVVFAVAAISVILGVAIFSVLRGWRASRSPMRLPWSLVLGGLIAGLIVGAGLYLAFSGALSGGVTYEEHQAQRTYLEPVGLALLGLVFLSVVFVGIITPRLLLPLLAVLLLGGFGIGLLNPKDLDGLHLFNRPNELEKPLAYAVTVEEYRQVETPSKEELEGDLTDSTGGRAVVPESLRDPVDPIIVSPLPFGTVVSLDASTSAEQIHEPEDVAVFQVIGAASTRYLRTGTGDVYRGGNWSQVDLLSLYLDVDTDFVDKKAGGIIGRLGEQEASGGGDGVNRVLIGIPGIQQDLGSREWVLVYPAGEFRAFDAGVLPTSPQLERINAHGSYSPGSLTFATSSSIYGYRFAYSFRRDFRLQTAPAARTTVDAMHLELPESLPDRVITLASEIAEGETPLEKVGSIAQYLAGEYTYGIAMDGEEPQEVPPGRDPVDWFLFDSRTGDSRNFSSAFVVLARAAGVPARVVSGWSIEQTSETQVVHVSQRHQWAEVVLEEATWTTIDPTPGEGLTPPQPVFPPEETSEGDEQKLERTLEDLFESDDLAVRLEAVAELAKIDDEIVWQALIFAALLDEDERIREAAAEALQIEWTVDLWIQILREYWEAPIRALAAEALGDLQDLKAVGPLAEALGSDEDSGVRKAAAEALAKLGDQSAVDALAEALLTDVDLEVRIAATNALEMLGGPEAIAALEQALSSDADAEVKTAVIYAFASLAGEDAVPAIAQAFLSDGDPEVRIAALRALEALAGEDAVGIFAQALLSDIDASVRLEIIDVLRGLGSEEAVEALIGVLRNDPAVDVRAEAALALGIIKDNRALPPLFDARSDDVVDEVRVVADLALKLWMRADLEPILRGDYDVSTRAIAAWILGEYGDHLAVPVLSYALADPAIEVREEALEALSKMGEITWLESGGGLLEGGTGDVAFIPSMTASSTTRSSEEAVFTVSGPNHTSVLRTAVGDYYNKGKWVPRDSMMLSYPRSRESISHEGAIEVNPTQGWPLRELISVSPAGRFARLLPGVLPTSPRMNKIDVVGEFWPESHIFVSHELSWGYRWDAEDPSYTREQLESAEAYGDYAYVDDPAAAGRIRELAETITAGHSSAYGKAEAIEGYLKAEYTYRFAESQEEATSPEGWDPVEWFLFGSREGTCGSFSSAFVLLARSVGIPARVVAGWAIAPTGESQTVYANQAHQWAEIALDGLGWVSFDPTPGGAPSRVNASGLSLAEGTSPAVRNWALNALRELLGDGSAGGGGARGDGGGGLMEQIQLAVQHLNAADDSLRDRAVDALNEMLGRVSLGGRGGGAGGAALEWSELQTLLQALSDADPSVRERAIGALELLAGGAGGGAGAGGGLGDVGELVASLSGSDAEEREEALDALRELGDVTQLENGGAIIEVDGGVSWIAGTTTRQSGGLSKDPVFNVTGARNTGYLRTAVGDVYENGGWRQLDPVSISHPGEGSIFAGVLSEFSNESGQFAFLPEWRRNLELLHRYRTAPARVLTDRIKVTPFDGTLPIPQGTTFTSLTLEQIDREGIFFPFSATFYAAEPTESFSWRSRIPVYSRGQLNAADAVDDSTYTQLPDDLPERVHRLAREITQGHSSAFSKAEALADYVSTRYEYRLADGPEDSVPPGRDPVDWFLFDHKEGTCGVFSSAFVVLARSVGIPARVVSGWMISPTAQKQTVGADQAHQWAEIALEGIGWVTFESTGPGGPPTRVSGHDLTTQRGSGSGGGSGGTSGGSGGTAAGFVTGPRIPAPEATVTNITEWPASVQREAPFMVGGTVRTRSGRAISGLTVQIFVNETKEHGGAKVGETEVRQGRFEAEVRVPARFEPGSYQLLARTVGNERFLESWSDPDVGVFSQSGLSLTGLTEAPVDVEAIFEGRLAEDTGEGIGGEELSVSIDGQRISSVVTGDDGGFSFARVFSNPGSHWVEVSFEGKEFFLETSARLDFKVTLPTSLTVSAPVQVGVGEEFVVTGRLHDVRMNALSGRTVSVTIGEGPVQTVRTSPTGEFETTTSVMDGGAVEIVAEFEGDGITLSSAGTTRVDVKHQIDIAIAGPSRVNQGDGATFTGDVNSDTLAELGQLDIVLEDASGQEILTVATAAGGTFRYNRLSFDDAGPLSIKAKFVGDDKILPAEASIAFAVLAPSSIALGGPSQVEQGTGGTFRGVISSDTRSPIGQRELVLEDSAGEQLATATTDSDGAFEYRHEVFDEAGPESITARFLGDDYISAAVTSYSFLVLAPTSMMISGPARIEQGTGGTFEGSINSETASPIGVLELVLEDSAGDEIVTVTTDEDGNFGYRHPSFDETGTTSITARFAGDDFIAPAETSFAFVVQAPTSLIINGPSQIKEGEGGTFQGSITSETLSPIGVREIVVGDGTGQLLEIVATEENGAFEYRHPAFDDAGPSTIAARFVGDDFTVPAEGSIAFVVQTPTSLSVEGPLLVRAGESFGISGSLLTEEGQPVPNATLTTNVASQPLLETDDEGRFQFEVGTAAEEDVEDGSVESELEIRVTFDGTDSLGAAFAELEVAVGIPRIVIEAADSVARGNALTVSGVVLLGTRAMPGLDVQIGESGTARTNEAGEFTYDYLIPAGAPLGGREVEVTEGSLVVNTSLPVNIKSATSLIVDALDKVSPGKRVKVNATLVDDTGAVMPLETIRSSLGVEAVTDEEGVALFEFAVPDSEGLLSLPVTFEFDGDGSNMPLSYYIGIPVTPLGFNWLLWVGLPGLLLVIGVGVYAGRRYRPVLMEQLARRMAPTVAPEPERVPVAVVEDLEVEDEVLPEPQPTQLAIAFQKESEDLADVWGVGEVVTMEFRLTDEDGGGLVGELIQVYVGEEQLSALTTDGEGQVQFIWVGDRLLDCVVKAEFAGDDELLPSVATRELRIVDFREEIVRLYNVFTGWVEPRISDYSKQLTPREIESRIIGEGLSVDEKALDQLISRFEEADYSEHPIARRHYEAMYRAWRTVVESQA